MLKKDTPSFKAHIGTDEAGKGDVFGPLCVAAVYADEKFSNLFSLTEKIVDSKKISDKKILEIAEEIKKNSSYQVLRLMPLEYNKAYNHYKNLNTLLAWMHGEVIERLYAKTGCLDVLVDQFGKGCVLKEVAKRGGIHLRVEERVRAESDLAVAAASILARASFLEGMEKLSFEGGFKVPKGAAHITEGLNSLKELFPRDEWNRFAKLHFKTFKNIL